MNVADAEGDRLREENLPGMKAMSSCELLVTFHLHCGLFCQ